MKHQLFAFIALLTPLALYGMDCAMEVAPTRIEAELYCNFVTRDGKTFKVPASFIKTSKTLKLEFLAKLQDFESQTSDITIDSSLIPSEIWKFIEPHYETLARLHALKKEIKKLKQEDTYVNSFGIAMEELSEQRNSELKDKYKNLKAVPYKDVIELLKNLRQKARELRKERAEIYTELYFSFKTLSYHQLNELILLEDFLQMPCLRSVVLSMAFRLPQLRRAIPAEAQHDVPVGFTQDTLRKLAGKRKSLLHWACSRGMLAVAKDLKNEGAQLEERNSQGNTPLHCAAIEGHADIVEYLLSIGANASTANHSALTPLQSACMYRNAETVRLLLGKGTFNVNCPDTERYRVFGRQAFAGAPAHPACNTALHLACGDRLCTELVFNYYSESGFRDILERKNDCGNTPLIEASKRQNDETVRYLLEKGANVRATNNAQRTALHEACDSTNYDLVKVLVEAGAPLDAVEASNCTPLHIACQLNDNISVVRYLATREGIDLSKTDKRGNTPLQIAASWNNLKLVQFFMEECARGFDDLKNQDLDSYRERVKNYLKQRKKVVAQRALDEKDERARLLAKAQNH